MTLRDIVEKYEIGKDKKNVVFLEVPVELKDKVEELLVDGYAALIRNPCTYLFCIYNIPELSKRTGLDFSSKIKSK